MSLILAVEPDRRQAAQLTGIIRHYVGAELILADTTEGALGAIGRRVPDLVLVPSANDMHQDHGVLYWEALRAFKKEASIWGYEHPWNNLTFTTDIFVRLRPEHLEKKIRALKEYKSQTDRGYMDERNIRSLVATRGAQLDIQYAEAFELIRLLY